jgi:hypothetical protein
MTNDFSTIINEILNIKKIININENINNVKLVDILINVVIGKLKMIYFDDGDKIGEYYWVKDDNVDYSSMTHSEFLNQYGHKFAHFYKNPWGMLWINNCHFIKVFKENIFKEEHPLENHELKNSMFREYFEEKFGVRIKKVSWEDCDDF